MNCLEEDHVCHGITTQEPRPRPMTETHHSRHHSTVLPIIGASKEDSLRNLHTHAVDLATKLLGNNRLLKERPSPIATTGTLTDLTTDLAVENNTKPQEQRLTRRQRCTISQLRLGHCHLLQDYKHRVFGEPRDICTDCGTSPQDVRHLFACNKRRTDLSPENLGRNPVRSIRALISTTGTLTDLATDLAVANNNNTGHIVTASGNPHSLVLCILDVSVVCVA